MICRLMRMTLLQQGVAGAKSSHMNIGLKTGRGIGGSLKVMAPSLVSNNRPAALCRCGGAVKFV